MNGCYLTTSPCGRFECFDCHIHPCVIDIVEDWVGALARNVGPKCENIWSNILIVGEFL